MNLVSFSVENFRSITKARKIKLGRTAVLLGPNNEGKSNLLRALVNAMRILTEGSTYGLRSNREFRIPSFAYRRIYQWESDYPIHLQKSRPSGTTSVIIEFALEPNEIVEFRRKTGSALNGTLPIRIVMGRAEAQVSVAKQGRGATALTAKSGRIASFVSARVRFTYVPAVRTAASAQRVVDAMVAQELETVEQDPSYIAALRQIAAVQQPVLDQLSRAIKATLVQFLPAITDVRVQVAAQMRTRALRRCEIFVDDGTATELKSKGDGVQSLAALGLMRHGPTASVGTSQIVAIEEPESHLHPSAIHELKKVLNEVAQTHQVVLTTHCPLFVDRVNVGSNVIVYKSRATPAKSIQEVRDILGVRAGDNLRHADVVLLVEGQEDRVALLALLAAHSAQLRAALEHRTLAIDTLGGGSNLPYKVGLIRDALCACHVFLDDDKAGREAFTKCLNEALLTPAEVHFTKCKGMKDAEFEDMLETGLYAPMLATDYGVDISLPVFRTRSKWSARLEDTFVHHGKLWDDRVKAQVKSKVSALVAEAPTKALSPHRRLGFDALATALSNLLGEAARKPSRKPSKVTAGLIEASEGNPTSERSRRPEP